ncbi:MAG TPA: DNA-processing protein DprA [Bacteroidales bacterium]|nr:DNA-processing protein DprA [Bacteroidales bacterium]
MSRLHQIALTFIPAVGDVIGKKLVAVCGSPEAVFSEKKPLLLRVDGVGPQTVESILANRENALARAESELEQIERYNIATLFYTEKDYPYRLKECTDGPLLIYYKGNASLNSTKIVAVVGTRRATPYGKDICQQFIEELASQDVTIVSGLAYGIDTCAHKSALDNGLRTVGVLAHGLDRIYPQANRSLAGKMVAQGGILTDYPMGTNPDRENFPTRNRVIAGLSDAVIVIEAGMKGGALITAEIANSYNRDVFAVPGRIGDYFSEGCNFLIKTNRAHLFQSVEDVRYIMNWDKNHHSKTVQPKLLTSLDANEEKVVDILKCNPEVSFDRICQETGLGHSAAASALLNLEFEGIIRCLPGKMYKMVK